MYIHHISYLFPFSAEAPLLINLLLLHRLLLKEDNPKISIDHCNGDTLNNKKFNLRKCSNRDNIRNQKIHKNNKSGYKGVCWIKDRNKWKASINIEKYKNKHIGYFKDKIEAAIAYNNKAKEVFGEFARLNEL